MDGCEIGQFGYLRCGSSLKRQPENNITINVSKSVWQEKSNCFLTKFYINKCQCDKITRRYNK